MVDIFDLPLCDFFMGKCGLDGIKIERYAVIVTYERLSDRESRNRSFMRLGDDEI